MKSSLIAALLLLFVSPMFAQEPSPKRSASSALAASSPTVEQITVQTLAATTDTTTTVGCNVMKAKATLSDYLYSSSINGDYGGPSFQVEISIYNCAGELVVQGNGTGVPLEIQVNRDKAKVWGTVSFVNEVNHQPIVLEVRLDWDRVDSDYDTWYYLNNSFRVTKKSFDSNGGRRGAGKLKFFYSTGIYVWDGLDNAATLSNSTEYKTILQYPLP